MRTLPELYLTVGNLLGSDGQPGLAPAGLASGGTNTALTTLSEPVVVEIAHEGLPAKAYSRRIGAALWGE